MKHLLLVFLCALCFQSAYSQACVIDTGNYSLITPAADELPCIERGKNYQIVLQFYTPSQLAGFTINSITVTTFNNLPTNITTMCTPANCTMPGDGRACITIYGNTLDTVGTYNIVYDGFINTSQGTAPFSYIRQMMPGALPEYYLDVIEDGAVCRGTTSIATQSGSREIEFSVMPNPNNGVFSVEVSKGINGITVLKISDATGRNVYGQTLTSNRTTIDMSGFAKGVYFVQLQTTDGFSVRKINLE